MSAIVTVVVVVVAIVAIVVVVFSLSLAGRTEVQHVAR
jgi:hypothetical protein